MQRFKKARKGRLKSSHLVAGEVRVLDYDLNYGDYGLYAAEGGRLTERQLEAGRRSLRRSLERTGKVWVRVVADIPVSAKPSEVRMGKGKGAISHRVARVKPGQMIYEILGNKDIASKALKSASKKLPISMKMNA